jgi:hypothetical protein
MQILRVAAVVVAMMAVVVVVTSVVLVVSAVKLVVVMVVGVVLMVAVNVVTIFWVLTMGPSSQQQQHPRRVKMVKRRREVEEVPALTASACLKLTLLQPFSSLTRTKEVTAAAAAAVEVVVVVVVVAAAFHCLFSRRSTSRCGEWICQGVKKNLASTPLHMRQCTVEVKTREVAVAAVPVLLLMEKAAYRGEMQRCQKEQRNLDNQRRRASLASNRCFSATAPMLSGSRALVRCPRTKQKRAPIKATRMPAPAFMGCREPPR